MASDRNPCWAGEGKTHRSALASPGEEAGFDLPPGTAVVRTQLCPLHPSACACLLVCQPSRVGPTSGRMPPAWVGSCRMVAPESTKLSSSRLRGPAESACFWFPLRVSRLTLIGVDWVTCSPLNQSLPPPPPREQECDWPGLDHMIIAGAWGGKTVLERKVKSTIVDGGWPWEAVRVPKQGSHSSSDISLPARQPSTLELRWADHWWRV